MRVMALVFLSLFALLTQACQSAPEATPIATPQLTRTESLSGLAKFDPNSDTWPPRAAEGWTQPVPLAGPINTAGVEDSPFLSPDGEWFFFVFIPNPNSTPQEQLLDGFSGIWVAQRAGDNWGEPQRVALADAGVASLDGCPTLFGSTIYFCSARQGNQRENDIYTVDWTKGTAANWQNAGELLNSNYGIGELHISEDGQTLVFASRRPDGLGGHDLWNSTWEDGKWGEPVNLGASVNTTGDENRPYLSQDGQTLWYDGVSRKGMPGPAIFRSQRQPDGSWSAPEEIVSQFAGEPNLSADGRTLYFVHHYFSADLSTMLEADIYVSYRINP